MKISIQHLTKVFPSREKKGKPVVAVNDMSIEIPSGKLVGLLGPSGCGKSTTLFMLSGLESPTQGNIFFDEQDVTTLAPERRGIGLVFQNYALYPHMTVAQNIMFPLLNMRIPKEQAKEKALDAARLVQIEELMARKPSELSGGQQQRVAIARALVKMPNVLLLDEPLSNLDAKLRVQMRSEIASLHNRLKATIIYVTHDQTEAMTLGTRIVVLKDGVIMQVDSPQKLYNEPNNLFVAGFIGSPQMNFIDAVCKVEGERVTLNFEKTSVVLPPAKAKKLIDGGYNGKTVVMGIRPEDIGDSQIEIEAHKDAVFETDVTGYELLGSEVLLYFNVAGTAMTAKVDSRTTARMGDHITLAIDPEKIHCFDKETELTITN